MIRNPIPENQEKYILQRNRTNKIIRKEKITDEVKKFYSKV